MTIKRSGIIGLEDVQNEFGGEAPISINEYYRNGAYTTGNNIVIPTSGGVSINQFYGASRYVPGVAVVTSTRSIILPPNVGSTLYYYCIGGGGGGGGGSSRIGYGYGAGGGGGSGGAATGSFSVAPNDTITCVVGGSGVSGAARDGPYSSGSSGGIGGTSTIRKNGSTLVYGFGGGGGSVAQYGVTYSSVFNQDGDSSGWGWESITSIVPNVTPGGAVGTISGGSLLDSGDSGQTGQNGIWWSVGGQGGRGYNVTASTAGASFTRGAYGTGGIGYHNGYNLVRIATPGTGYGAGGSGGGAYMGANGPAFNGSAGVQGMIVIWW